MPLLLDSVAGYQTSPRLNKCQHQPITIELMYIIFQSLNFSDYNCTMLWVFGFLRTGEFTVDFHFNPDIHLAAINVQADSLVNPGSFRIHSKCSKTGPFTKVHWCWKNMISAPCMPLYLPVCGSTPGPLSFSDGTTLHCQWLTSNIQSILPAAGVPRCYTGHNFRIGAAKIAASCGLPDHLIKILGRWSSDAYQIYIRNPVSTIVGVAALTGICCISFS